MIHTLVHASPIPVDQWISGISKILAPKVEFLSIFQAFPSAGSSCGWRLFGGIARDTRRRGLNSPCISPYLGFRARSGCGRERGDLGGNERAEPPRYMARDSLSDECIYASHSPPVLFGDKSDQRGIALKFIHRKTRPFSPSTLAPARKSPSFPVRLVTFPKRVPNVIRRTYATIAVIKQKYKAVVVNGEFIDHPPQQLSLIDLKKLTHYIKQIKLSGSTS